jgi:ribosome-binding factor A
MSSRRLLKAAEAIREVVGLAILTDLRDPRIQDVTVTFVEVAPDMRLARVHVSVMGDERKQQLSLHGLQSSAGFLQHKISKRIDTRYTPKLKFVLDKGIKNAMRVTQILKEVLPDEVADDEELAESRPAHEIAHDQLRGSTESTVAETKPRESNDNEGAV